MSPISERHTSSSLHKWKPKRGGVSLKRKKKKEEKKEDDVARRETSQPFGTGSGETKKVGVGRRSVGFCVYFVYFSVSILYLFVDFGFSTSQKYRRRLFSFLLLISFMLWTCFVFLCPSVPRCCAHLLPQYTTDILLLPYCVCMIYYQGTKYFQFIAI